MRIVFMGTPEFAVATLDTLVQHHYDIVGVVTAPDKPAGRGKQLSSSAVKKYAVDHQLNLLQPTNLKDPGFIETLKALQADLFVVVAFRMLPEVVWSLPAKGTFNLHASLLPAYRGAAPINWAIINGETQSGVTTFFIRHEIDTGAIILQQPVEITEFDTAGDLHDVLMEAGADLVLKTVQQIEAGTEQVREQDMTGNYPKAPKIFKEDCRINWEQNTETVHNFIRGLSPYPTAFTTLQDKQLKIFKAKKVLEPNSLEPGSYEIPDGKQLRFATTDGFIEVLELQLEGKKRMPTEAFLQGFRA